MSAARFALLSMLCVGSLAACGGTQSSATSGNGADEGDGLVPTETTAEAASVTSTPGASVWTKVWRSAAANDTVEARATATDATGEAYLLRTFTGVYSGVPTTNVVDVTAYSPTGNIDSRTTVGGFTGVDGSSVRIAAGGGRVVVAGNYRGAQGSGGGAVIAVQDVKGGRYATPRITPGAQSNAEMYAVAVDTDGSFAVIGSVIGTVDFGLGSDVDANTNTYDAFVARYDANGTPLWTKRFDGRTAGSVAYGADHSLYVSVVGTFAADGSDTSTSTVGRFDASGSLAWSSSWTCERSCALERLAVGKDGSVVVAGAFFKSMSGVGFATMTESPATKYGQPFVMMLGPAGVRAVQTMPGNARRVFNGLAIDSYGSAVFAMQFTGNVTFSNVPSSYLSTFGTPSGSYRTVVAKLASSGTKFLWTKQFASLGTLDGQNGHFVGTDLAVTSSDRIVMSGQFYEKAKFGGTTYTGNGYGVAFFTRLYQ